MSSREPMWYCHECHAEMRPLMVPDPICASCRGSFVEKIEDSTDDPRAFAGGPGPGEDIGEDPFDNFLVNLQTLLNRGMQRTSTEHTPPRQQSPRVTFQFRSSSGPQGTWTLGGSNTLNASRSSTSSPNPGAAPTMSEFVRSAPAGSTNDRDGSMISGPLFAQYLTSLLGQTQHPLLPLVMGGMPESGRLGDYVFSQEALDQIITQIMESSNTNRPVPATEEIIGNLPREVLEEGSELLSKDCAVCKDQFQLATEDPDEQIIITLPCKHPFHEPCIIPWLKSSGTCPVCRHPLTPQPEYHPPPNDTSGQSPRARPRSPPAQSDAFPGGGGLFTTLLGSLAGLGPGNNASSSSGSDRSSRPSSSSHPHQRSNSDPSTSPNQRNRSSSASDRRSRSNRPHVPGQWSEDADMDLD